MPNPEDPSSWNKDFLGERLPLYLRVPAPIPKAEIKKNLDDIAKRLDRIEKGLKELTGPQLINGIWR